MTSNVYHRPKQNEHRRSRCVVFMFASDSHLGLAGGSKSARCEKELIFTW